MSSIHKRSHAAEQLARQKQKSKRTTLLIIPLVLVIIAVAAGIYFRFRKQTETTPPEEPIRSIAVLPFVDVSPDQDQKHLGDGIAIAIIPSLNTVDGLRVIDRTSSFQFRDKEDAIDEIGEKLKVEAVLEGSVVKYEKQSLGLRHFKKTGKLLLSKTNIEINTQIKDFQLIKEVRIIPRSNHYVIEVVYEKEEKVNNGDIITSIDPGLNNLSTLTFSDGRTPLIFNGKPIQKDCDSLSL